MIEGCRLNWKVLGANNETEIRARLVVGTGSSISVSLYLAGDLDTYRECASLRTCRASVGRERGSPLGELSLSSSQGR